MVTKNKQENLIDFTTKISLTPEADADNIFSGKFQYKPRLNGIDSKMLNEEVPLDDNTIKIGARIAKMEEKIHELELKISSTEQLGKLPEVVKLRMQSIELNNKLKKLKTYYAQKKSLSRVLVKNKYKKHVDFPVIRAIQRFILRKILVKVSKKIRSFVILSDSLDMLSGINKSVDELIEMRIPYGENAENYRQLTSYLYRANKIRSQIIKAMGK